MVLALGHFLGIEFLDGFLVILDALYGDVPRIGHLGIAAGHADRLQEADLIESRHIISAGLLNLPQDGKDLLGVISHRDAHLGHDEVTVLEPGGHKLSGLPHIHATHFQ